MKSRNWPSIICLCAGAMDTATGLGLLLVPHLTLTLMGLAAHEGLAAYLRFIGAFVFGVGGLYLAAWQCCRLGRPIEWRVLWLATAWLRLCVGITVTILIATASLDWLWISVPISDLGLAAYQFSSRKP